MKTMTVLGEEVVVVARSGCDSCMFYEKDKVSDSNTHTHCRITTSGGPKVLCLSSEARAKAGDRAAAFITFEKYAELRIKGQL